MTDLHCDVTSCANNKSRLCCRPDIMVGGPRAVAGSQTYCANFTDHASGAPSDAVDSNSPNPSLDIHCEAEQCTYNQDRACSADRISIRTTKVNSGQVKTECSTFESREDY